MFGTKPDFSAIAPIRSRRSSGRSAGSTTPKRLTSLMTRPYRAYSNIGANSSVGGPDRSTLVSGRSASTVRT